MFRSIQTKFAHHALNTIGVFTQSGAQHDTNVEFFDLRHSLLGERRYRLPFDTHLCAFSEKCPNLEKNILAQIMS